MGLEKDKDADGGGAESYRKMTNRLSDRLEGPLDTNIQIK